MGIRDENALESALTRHDADSSDLAALAACYRDGNKRIGFPAMVTFLGINGRQFDATDAEVISEIVAGADGSVSEDALAAWVRSHTSKRP